MAPEGYHLVRRATVGVRQGGACLCLEDHRRFTIFVGSTSAIDRVRSDSTGAGQSFAIIAIERCSQAMTRSNEVIIRWVPAHHGITGNEKADEFTEAAAEGSGPDNTVLDELRWETGLSHMTRVAAEGRSRRMAQ